MIYRKKLPLLFSLLFTAGLVGCISEQEIEPEGGIVRPVVFAPQVSPRAATGHPIENGATIPEGDYYFGVFAWVKLNSTDPMEPFAELQNEKVQHASAAEYTYDPVASWPRGNDARLACMAYYPWSDNSGNIKVTPGTGANQTMTIEYTVPSSSADHMDLMYAKTSMTPGYDPVNLNFGHALARLKFEGRTEGYPGGAILKIIGVKITGATLKGELEVLDPITQTGKPEWTLSTAPGDKGTITMPSAHISDVSLTYTLQSVITPGGDMLVIPQEVDGLTVEVTATLGGIQFPEPFVFSLTSSPDWTMNEIITYEITLTPDGMHLTANVTDWTTDLVNVIHDGQWWLSVNKDEHMFETLGGDFTLTAETNYNISTQGYPAGLQIDVAEIVYEPAVTPGSEWLTLTNLTGSDGDLQRTIEFAAATNTTTVERSAKIYVKAGNLSKVINIKQALAPPPIPPELGTGSGNTSQIMAYVGAFWRAGQTGERVIKIPTTTAAYAGNWAVQVLEYGDFSVGDIVFLAGGSADPNIYEATPGNAEDYQVNSTSIAIAGTATAGTGTADGITFRIGLKSKWNSSHPNWGNGTRPVRYAKILVSFGNDNYQYMRVLWLRQGEEADYLIHPDDVAETYKNYVRKFLPYNLTAPDMSEADYTNVGVNGGTWTEYPSQAGAFFQLAGASGYERRAWHPSKTSVSGWSSSFSDWSATHETCPAGYRRLTVSDGTNATNEFAQSLLADASSTGLNNATWGYLADGFFDRREIVANSTVESTTCKVAYMGMLFYNSVVGSVRQNASIFFPAAGSRNYTSGALTNVGSYGYYWPATLAGTNAFYMRFNSGGVYPSGNGSRAYGFSVRCVAE